jgi:hypothetical protein
LNTNENMITYRVKNAAESKLIIWWKMLSEMRRLLRQASQADDRTSGGQLVLAQAKALSTRVTWPRPPAVVPHTNDVIRAAKECRNVAIARTNSGASREMPTRNPQPENRHKEKRCEIRRRRSGKNGSERRRSRNAPARRGGISGHAEADESLLFSRGRARALKFKAKGRDFGLVEIKIGTHQFGLNGRRVGEIRVHGAEVVVKRLRWEAIGH